jgi:hypothetical protein
MTTTNLYRLAVTKYSLVKHNLPDARLAQASSIKLLSLVSPNCPTRSHFQRSLSAERNKNPTTLFRPVNLTSLTTIRFLTAMDLCILSKDPIFTIERRDELPADEEFYTHVAGTEWTKKMFYRGYDITIL